MQGLQTGSVICARNTVLRIFGIVGGSQYFYQAKGPLAADSVEKLFAEIKYAYERVFILNFEC